MNFLDQIRILHDPSEIMKISQFAAEDTFVISMLKKLKYAALYFCANRERFYFSEFTDEWKVQKNSIYLK